MVEKGAKPKRRERQHREGETRTRRQREEEKERSVAPGSVWVQPAALEVAFPWFLRQNVAPPAVSSSTPPPICFLFFVFLSFGGVGGASSAFRRTCIHQNAVTRPSLLLTRSFLPAARLAGSRSRSESLRHRRRPMIDVTRNGVCSLLPLPSPAAVTFTPHPPPPTSTPLYGPAALR